jgi:hypothetical protein
MTHQNKILHDGDTTYSIGLHVDVEGFLAMTLTSSKRFATKRGALRWLAARGYDANGNKAISAVSL